MISPVDKYIKDFADAGADIITFHPEATDDIENTIKLIKKNGKKVGVSLKPKTNINTIEYIRQSRFSFSNEREPICRSKFMPEVLPKLKIEEHN